MAKRWRSGRSWPPTSPPYRRARAAGDDRVGRLEAGLGRRAEAEAQYGKARASQAKLAADFPAVPTYRQELATSHNSLGNLLKDLGKGSEAEAQHGKALA